MLGIEFFAKVTKETRAISPALLKYIFNNNNNGCRIIVVVKCNNYLYESPPFEECRAPGIGDG